MEGVYSLQPEQVWGERESQQLQVNTSPSVKLRKFQQRSSWWDVRTELQPLEESWFMNQQSQQNCCKDTNCRNKRWDLFVCILQNIIRMLSPSILILFTQNTFYIFVVNISKSSLREKQMHYFSYCSVRAISACYWSCQVDFLSNDSLNNVPLIISHKTARSQQA